MKLRQELIEYSHDILDGKIIACKKHKNACQRFLNDLEREGTEEFPYIFKEEEGEKFLDWMRIFKHTKGILAGQYIEPHIIQKFIFGNVYGWYHKDTGLRRFRKFYWQVARKGTKSQSLSCVGSYEMMGLREPGSEVYCAATKTEQAKIVFNETVRMLGKSALKEKVTVSYGKLIHEKSDSFMRALSEEDGKSGDGLNPQCGIIDKICRFKIWQYR